MYSYMGVSQNRPYVINLFMVCWCQIIFQLKQNEKIPDLFDTWDFAFDYLFLQEQLVLCRRGDPPCEFSTVQVKYEWINPARDPVDTPESSVSARIILLLPTRVGVCHLRVDRAELLWRRLPPFGQGWAQ